MNNKKRILSILLMLVIIANPVFSWTSGTVLAEDTGNTGNDGNVETITIEDETLREQLEKCLNNYTNNKGAIISLNGNEMEIDFNKIGYLGLKDVSFLKDSNATILTTLLSKSANLEYINLQNCNLSGFDFSSLNNSESLQTLTLYSCGLTLVPNLTLPNLTTLYLSDNNFPKEGACDSLTCENFPKLEKLYLDWCLISDVSFLKNMGTNLTALSLGRNRLTDDSLEALIGMKDNLSNLTELNLGAWIHKWGGSNGYSALSNSNNITDTAKLASLLMAFPKLKKSDLSDLKITSLQEFAILKDNDDIEIDFTRNSISDFAGLERKTKFNLKRQEWELRGNYAPGLECEIPELLSRIIDKDDALYGNEKLTYKYCELTDDGKILISPDAKNDNTGATVTVKGGKLGDGFDNSTITFVLKSVPVYEVPQGLTAAVDDTLAQVTLPEGFTWKDSTLSVGEVGEHSFKAVYTPENTEKYVVIDNVDVTVTVHEHQCSSEWKNDGTHHWHECMICGKPIDRLPHSFGAWITDKDATETEAGTKHRVCECGYEENETIPQKEHEHQYSSEWKNNGTHHWHECSTCDTKKDIAAHSFGAWITDKKATESEAGTRHRVCDICGYTENGMIAATGGGNQGNNQGDNQGDNPSNNQSGNQGDTIEESPDNKLTDAFITGQKTDKDIKGSTFGKLRAKASKTKTKSITLTWNKVKGADGYLIFGNMCGKTNHYKLMKIIKKKNTNSFTHKNLKKGTFYKYIVCAYKIVNGKRITIAASKTIHATTSGGKKGNLKTIKLNKKSIKLKLKKTFKIKAKEVKQSKPLAHHRKICFESSNTKIATVSEKGVIKAKKKGSCTIYVYGLNGVYKTVKVKAS